MAAVFQYHSKVSCFMLQQIEEPCSLGVHAAVVIPPTWILRARRPQVSPSFVLSISSPMGLSSRGSSTPPIPLQNTLKASKKKKRASFKRRSSKKGPEVRPGLGGWDQEPEREALSVQGLGPYGQFSLAQVWPWRSEVGDQLPCFLWTGPWKV